MSVGKPAIRGPSKTMRSRVTVAIKNPSTAGARWIFAEREYLRRVGRGRKNKDRFEELKKFIQGASYGDLKRRLSELRVQYGNSPSRSSADFQVAEILLIDGELGYRKSEGVGTPQWKEWQFIVLKNSLCILISEIGEDRLREILEGSGFRSSGVRDEDVPAVVSGMIDYTLRYIDKTKKGGAS